MDDVFQFEEDDDAALLASAEDYEEHSGLCPPSSSTCLPSEPSQEALSTLKKYFGHSSFRPMQWQIVRNAVAGRDQVIVMSTGYGKSVCYQMPSLLRQNLTLIISPLISLMNDQVTNVRANGVKAACVYGDMKIEERLSILDDCQNGQMRLLYITPEFVLNNDSILQKLKPNVGLIAIDEAHCVSQWGHEFRSSYRQLAMVRQVLNGVPIMALTATATAEVRADISTSLGLRDQLVLCSGLDRTNLYIDVRTPTRLEALRDLVTEEDRLRGKHFGGPTIIYCPTRATVDEVGGYLSRLGVVCATYHAGMSSSTRAKAHESFCKDKVTTIVATVAFGMGIDKPDVRVVIHYGAPRTIESYYQEIGRAGRDGYQSKCIVFYSQKELAANKARLIRDNVLAEPYKSHAAEMQRRMEKLLVTRCCRRFMILSHFDPSAKKTEARAGCCDVCDEELNGDKGASVMVDYGEEVAMVFTAIYDVFDGRSGVSKAIDFLKGKPDVWKSKQGHDLYGAGIKRSETFWKELCRLLRINDYFTETKCGFNAFAYTVSLSQKALKWRASGKKEFLLEPTPLLLGRVRVKDGGTTKYISIPASGEKPQSKFLQKSKQRQWRDCSQYSQLSEATMELYPRDLEKELMDLRMSLVMEQDVSAYAVASNKCLQQLAIVRPSCVENTHMINEMSEEKRRKYGAKFVEVCVNYSKLHNLPMDCSLGTELPAELTNAVENLSDSNAEVYRLHVKGKLNCVELASSRSLSESTIAQYFVNFIKNGLPVHLDVLNIDKDLINKILSTIRENGSDILRLKPVMEKLPEGTIDYNRLKMIFALLEYEYGTEDDSNAVQTPDTASTSSSEPATSEPSSKRSVPQWMTSCSKAVIGPPQAKRTRSSNLFR